MRPYIELCAHSFYCVQREGAAFMLVLVVCLPLTLMGRLLRQRRICVIFVRSSILFAVKIAQCALLQLEPATFPQLPFPEASAQQNTVRVKSIAVQLDDFRCLEQIHSVLYYRTDRAISCSAASHTPAASVKVTLTSYFRKRPLIAL